jgi:DHA2 family multidrug resistance protein
MAAALGRRLDSVDADVAALRRVYAIVQREALILAYNDVLHLMALLFFLAIPLVLLLRKPNASGGAEAH